MSSSHRRLIVNADDFGMSPGVNEGIAKAHEKGILTSASLMVRYPAAPAAVQYAQVHPDLSLGLHLDLGEWTVQDHEWRVLYEVVPLEDAAALAEEIQRQLKMFRELTGTEPSHLDSHQHVHQSEPVRSLCLRAAEARGIVLRHVDPRVRYCGEFYGQSSKGYPFPEGISVEALTRLIQTMPAGVTELACHPALRVDMAGMYKNERVIECQTLCDPRVRAAVLEQSIGLCSFKDV